MVEKVSCDLCGKEIDISLEELYFMSYGRKGRFIIDKREKKGDLCQECFKKINEFIKSSKVNHG